jgi:hypothetical protein
VEIDDHPASQPVAGPSREHRDQSSISAPGLSRTQAAPRRLHEDSDIRHLRELANGNGISEWSWAGLVEEF